MAARGEPIGRCCFAVICLFLLGIGIGVGIVIGMFPLCDEDSGGGHETIKIALDEQIINSVDKIKIEEHLKMLSEFPHIAGKPKNLELGRRVHDHWKEVGLDEVRIKEYDVLLSYPDPDNPNIVSLFNNLNSSIYSSPPKEKILYEAENKTGVVLPFLAYSPAGVVTGDLVYVNYGRVEDYVTLGAAPYNIDVKGKIVLARYGGIFRGDIAHIASQHGAIGVIIYSDPKDYAPDNTKRPYPHSWWLPPSGTQRGTIFEGNGDPLTPDYPATEFAYRLQENATDPPLPSIPAHAIDAEVAGHIFSDLTGKEAPTDWRGNLNVRYSLGPTFRDNMKIKLNVSTTNQRKKITNVIGIIKGAVEPDRYVMIGNHRDAWVFGAMDPSSGTAIMMEMARVLTTAMKTNGWRPRRSIVFCSWDAEEYGLVGSTEFVQDYVKTLINRAVAYLNVDIAVVGNYTLQMGGSPLLYRTAVSATSKVMSPNSREKNISLYQEWLARTEMMDKNKTRMGRPNYISLGSGSDFTNFRGQAGVPVLAFMYLHDTVALKVEDYPLYHSEYETFYAVKEFVDPTFKYHRAIGQLWLSLAIELSEPELLPFNLDDYAWTLNRLKDQLIESEGQKLEKKIPHYDTNLTEVIEEFAEAATQFKSRSKDIHDSLSVRQINDQLIQLERAFLDSNGIPGRTHYKHLIFAPSSHNSYAPASFPGIVDLLHEIKDSDHDQWEKVKQHFSVILFTIQSATSTLRDVGNFM